jgi:hypothetical protein
VAAPWQPLIVRLALEFPEVTAAGGWGERRRTALPLFIESMEVKRVNHKEKLYLYYALLSPKHKDILQKCLETPYNRVEAMALLPSGRRAILREYPLYEQGLWMELRDLNRKVELAAHRARWDAQNVPKERRTIIGTVAGEELITPWKAKPELLFEIGDLYAQMHDYKRAAHAYQSADICWGVDTSIVVDDRTPHPAWEKLAALYEKIGDWDMALHWRLKQLAGTVDDRRSGGPERTHARRKELTDKIIYLLARIGAGEPVEPPPLPQYAPEKLRRISQLYLDMWFPREALKVVELIEQVARKEQTEDRARIWETTAEILAKLTASDWSGLFWVVFWDQVWTYDKVVAVHKQAIEWGKKAGWEEARLKKLEEQITKLPDLLKYVKEPKNFQDLLDGKASEPKW